MAGPNNTLSDLYLNTVVTYANGQGLTVLGIIFMIFGLTGMVTICVTNFSIGAFLCSVQFLCTRCSGCFKGIWSWNRVMGDEKGRLEEAEIQAEIESERTDSIDDDEHTSRL